MAITGLITVGVGFPIADIVYRYDNFSKVPVVLMVLSLIPVALAVVGAIVWAILTTLILIWR
jgi:hypothetical protein